MILEPLVADHERKLGAQHPIGEHPMRSMKFVFVLLAAGALIVGGCGDDSSAEKGASNTTGNAVDRAFVADMLPHHRSAVQMATIAKARGDSAFVTQLADEIVRTQNREIATSATPT